MLWDELHQTWTERSRRNAPKPFRREQTLLPDEVRERLERAAKVEAQCPDAVELVNQIPDVVRWLRAHMVGRPMLGDGGRPAGKAQSRPPFRIAYMSAADREVAALGYWCDRVGVHTSHHLWRWPDGRVRGVVGDDLSGVFDLVDQFTQVLLHGFVEDTDRVARPVVPKDVLSDPLWGLWTVRSQHFNVWPELAAFLHTAEQEVEEADGVLF